MQQALADAWLVLTDSGGLREEAPTFKGTGAGLCADETEASRVLEASCAALGSEPTEAGLVPVQCAA